MVKSTLYSKIPLEYYFGPVKAECSRLISCVLYGFLLCMCKSVIGLCALWENNALQYISQSQDKLYQPQEQAIQY